MEIIARRFQLKNSTADHTASGAEMKTKNTAGSSRAHGALSIETYT
jgi:hypothetical protein